MFAGSPISLIDHIAGAALGCVWLLSVCNLVFGWTAAGLVAATGLVMYLLLQARRLPMMAGAVLSGAGIASVACALQVENPTAVLNQALNVACFFVSVLLSGGFLREAADHSPMVRAAGEALISQPPARRNAALSLGAFLMGFILSFGTLQLLGSMVKRANTVASANGDLAVQATRLRRSMVAILRGFCMSTVCNPISIVIALALTYSPGADWSVVMIIVVPLALGLLIVGAILDWWSEPRVGPSATKAPSLAPVRNLILLVGFVIASVLSIAELVGLRVIDAIVVTVPAIAFAWMTIQHRGHVFALLARLEYQAVSRFPAQRVEVTILASAGVAGAFLAAALPVDQIAVVVQSWSLPAVALPLIVFWCIFIGAQLALNPILTVTIAGAVLPAPLVLGAPPEVVAVAYMAAWGIGTCGSPFTLSVLIVSGIAEHDSRTVAWHWNRVFALLSAAICSMLLSVFTLLR